VTVFWQFSDPPRVTFSSLNHYIWDMNAWKCVIKSKKQHFTPNLAVKQDFLLPKAQKSVLKKFVCLSVMNYLNGPLKEMSHERQRGLSNYSVTFLTT